MTEAAAKSKPLSIDQLDAKIAYARFAGLKQAQIAKVCGVTPATVAQRVKVKGSFYADFQRFAAGIEAVYHAVGGEDMDDPDVWQDERFLQEQALLQHESDAMLLNGRA